MNSKLYKIREDGLENLQIVLDFDRTITAHRESGKQATSLVHFLRNSDVLGEIYANKANANFNKYFPFENDHTMDGDEQKRMMEKWWHEHLQMVVDHGLTLSHVRQIAENSDLLIREGLQDFFNFANENNIPVIIFSANVLGKESIEFFLKRFGLDTTNVQILTNELDFDENGISRGYNKRVVHSKNKNEELIAENLKRKNTILAGDGLGDADMVRDEEGRTVYRLAVLDEILENKLPIYKKLFDEILTVDSTFTFFDLVRFLKFQAIDGELKKV